MRLQSLCTTTLPPPQVICPANIRNHSRRALARMKSANGQTKDFWEKAPVSGAFFLFCAFFPAFLSRPPASSLFSCFLCSPFPRSFLVSHAPPFLALFAFLLLPLFCFLFPLPFACAAHPLARSLFPVPLLLFCERKKRTQFCVRFSGCRRDLRGGHIFFHEEGEKKITIGIISSRPINISKDKIILEK